MHVALLKFKFDPCLVTFLLFAPRVIHMSSMSARPLAGTSTAYAIDPFWFSSFDIFLRKCKNCKTCIFAEKTKVCIFQKCKECKKLFKMKKVKTCEK